MSINNARTWWEIYRETISITKHHRQLLTLLDNRQDLVQKIITLEKIKYPDQTELWYLTNIINELQRNDFMKNVS